MIITIMLFSEYVHHYMVPLGTLIESQRFKSIVNCHDNVLGMNWNKSL